MMDDLDRRLLALLRADSRAPVATLAARLKVSRGTVQNRIDRMMRPGGAIQGFTVRTRPLRRARVMRGFADGGQVSTHPRRSLRAGDRS